MLQLVQAFPQIMAIGGDILVANLDFPRADELAKRLQAAMQGQQQAPQPDPASEAKALRDFASAQKTQAETQGVALDNLAKRFGLGV
jgi:hypothetical protein